jgi:uracil-DNA glycosylase family 4
MDYPANCQVCELYKTCKTYKQPRHATQRKVDILLVGATPADSQFGIMSDGAGDYLKTWMQWWDGPWAYTTVVKCAPPDRREPKQHEVEACRRYLQEDIEQADPTVIVALGGAALKALWPDGPTSIVKAKGAPIQLGNRWLIVTYSPTMHLSGRQDLTPEYTRVFELATQICEGRYLTERPDIREVRTQDDYQAMLTQVQASHEVALDVENPTTSFHDDPTRYTFWMTDPAVICLGVGTEPKKPVWVMRRQWITADLLRLIAKKHIVGANVKHDLTALAWDVWPGFLDAITSIDDTMLWHGSRNQDEWGNGLKEMAERYLGAASWVWPVRRALDAERARVVAARGEQRKRQRTAEKLGHPFNEEPISWPTFTDVDWPTLVEYNGKDVWYTMRLIAYLREKLEPAAVYRSLLVPGTLTLARMELAGVGADPLWRSGLEVAFTEKVEYLRRRLHEFPEVKRVCVKQGLTCEPDAPKTWFNPKSPPHKEALLDECNVEVTETTATGRPKTDKRVVAELITQGYTVWKYVQALTQTRDRLSKFVIPLAHHIARDNRIHPNFKAIKVQTSSDVGADYSGGAETGRMAVSDPAMHNNVKDAIFRRMFVAAPGCVLLEMDHSAIEVRVVAWLSDCRSLAAMFSTGRDVYVQMAEKMFKKKGLTKKSPERDLAKTGTLAKIYRQGAAGLASRAGIMLHEAVDFQAQFDRDFPELEQWQQHLISLARKGEMYTTVWGRQWTFSPDARDNEIVNRPVQSSATDLCFWQAINAPHKPRLLLFTHDSHLIEVRAEEANEMARTHKTWMENRDVLPVQVTVPLVVEVKQGLNLGRMEVRE